MTEAPSHIIRLRAGRVRVLRLHAEGGHCYPLRYEAAIGAGCCRSCGCTDRYGCVDSGARGCVWVTAKRDLCSRCYERMLT